MSIRIRSIEGATVALCAARSVEKPGDIYLDDAAHQALSEKFAEDFQGMGFNTSALYDKETAIRQREESNNANRDWWDKTYGGDLA
jgi:hypothetical protein